MGAFFLFLLFVVVVIVIAVKNRQKDTSDNSSTSSSYTGYNPSSSNDSGKLDLKRQIYSQKKEIGNLDLYAKSAEIKLDNNMYKIIEVSIQGNVRVPYAGMNVNMTLTMFDKNLSNHESKGIILCDLPNLSYEDSNVFMFKSEPISIPYSNTAFHRVPLVKIPLDLLTFPRKGETSLEFTVEVSNGNRSYARTVVEYTYFNPKSGYLDIIDNKIKSEDLLVKIASVVASIDGEVHEKEKEKIVQWINKNNKSDDERVRKLKSVMNRTIKQWISTEEKLITKEQLIKKAKKLSKEISEIGSKSILYELLEVLSDIIGSDGQIDPEEKQLIDFIASNLNIDIDKYKEIYKNTIPANLVNASISPKDLGINDDMSIEERKEALRKEYVIWSRKVTSSDENTRKQAEEMLKVISEERAKLRKEQIS